MDVEKHVTDAFAEHRRSLVGVAYRMLGSFDEAEDVVQEAFLRFRAALADGTRPETDRAWLTTVVTRLAIDHLRSARVRRESYVGPWLPEPAVEGFTDLADDAALADSLSTAFLVLLERLGPEQRAVLLLHDVFDLGFDEIAKIVDKTESACRQIAVRARKHIQDERPRFATDQSEAARLADRFFAASQEGDLGELVALLAAGVEFVGDGGDSARGVTRIVQGREPVAKLVRGLFKQMRAVSCTLQPIWVGRQPGVLILDSQGALFGVWSLALDEQSVQAVHGVVNPEKLRHLGIPLTNLSRRP